MLTLHQFPAGFGVPNGSPFCMKLECFLRLTGIPYRTALLRDPAEAPKGKGPFIEDEGQKLGDSALIIAHLIRTRGIDSDAGLTPVERAAARAIGIMLEEHLYFALLYSRWIEEAGWPVVRDTYLAPLPPAAQDAVRERVRTRLRAQGMGLHTPEEIYALGTADIEALAAWLGHKPYLMGETPTTVDCIALGFTANLLAAAFATPLTAAARRQPNLVDYNERMLRRFFPEFVTTAAAA
jgi:glutathione S-transferase